MSIKVVRADSHETTLVDGDAVLLFEVGSALAIGRDVSLQVVDGNVILSGDVPTSDPAAAGAIWVDGSGFVRVSGGA